MVRATMLLNRPNFRHKMQANPCFHTKNRVRYKKCIFPEKRGCGHPPLTLEPPLPDEQRRSDGAPDGPDGSGDAEGWFGGEKKI